MFNTPLSVPSTLHFVEVYIVHSLSLHTRGVQPIWCARHTLVFTVYISEDNIASKDEDKARFLNQAFTTHFNKKTPPLTPTDRPSCSPMDCPDDLLCTEEEVLQLLSNLDTIKTNGHDDISAIMLKSTALSIAPIITELFNCSIKLGKIPTEWKIARVSPISKQGNSSNPSDYRPISLLSILSKILERHVANILIDHYSNILSSHQWGFTQGKSTSGALVTAIDAWHKLLDSGTEVCAIFFDYRKAFDTVSHTLLLQKLETAGVNIHILTWLHDYLCDRKQYVCVNGSSLRCYLSTLEFLKDLFWVRYCL